MSILDFSAASGKERKALLAKARHATEMLKALSHEGRLLILCLALLGVVLAATAFAARALGFDKADEIAIVCDKLGVNVWEVIDAAATKPFGYMAFYPGPGLGGHCIPIDPFYLTWKAREYGKNTRFIELAGEMGLTAARVAQMRQASIRPASLDAPIGDSDSAEFGDLIADDRAFADRQTLHVERGHRLHELVGGGERGLDRGELGLELGDLGRVVGGGCGLALRRVLGRERVDHVAGLLGDRPRIERGQGHLVAAAVAVADEEHPDHQLGIDRRPTGLAVVALQTASKIAQVKVAIDAAQQMILRDVGVEIEGVKQPILSAALPSHHLASPITPTHLGHQHPRQRPRDRGEFFNRVCRRRPLASVHNLAELPGRYSCAPDRRFRPRTPTVCRLFSGLFDPFSR